MTDVVRPAHVLLEVMGLFAMCEIMVDVLVKGYTSKLPSGLADVVLKRQISSTERATALSVVLQDKGLASVYPDLHQLFLDVRQHRDRIAHGSAGRAADGTLVITEVSKGKPQEHRWDAEYVRRLFKRAHRLRGLLTTLLFELGHLFEVRDDETTVTGFDVIGQYGQDEERRPYDLVLRMIP